MSVFRLEGSYDHKPSSAYTRFKFSCAQNKDRQRGSQKADDVEKHRGRIPMFVFDCKGWLYIGIYGDKQEAEISLQHKDDHVPYCVVSLPADVIKLIANGQSKTISQASFQLITTIYH